jgi:hypothetical protein
LSAFTLTYKEITPSRATFKELIHHSIEADVDTALKVFKTSSGLGVRTTTVEAYYVSRKLAELERWNGTLPQFFSHSLHIDTDAFPLSDILEVEKIAKKDNPQSPFRKLISLIFINARIS